MKIGGKKALLAALGVLGMMAGPWTPPADAVVPVGAAVVVGEGEETQRTASVVYREMTFEATGAFAFPPETSVTVLMDCFVRTAGTVGALPLTDAGTWGGWCFADDGTGFFVGTGGGSYLAVGPELVLTANTSVAVGSAAGHHRVHLQLTLVPTSPPSLADFLVAGALEFTPAVL